jgi:hypothetical protein
MARYTPPMFDAGRPEDMEAARDAATKKITASAHPLRVMVAGPGTGKTTAFAEALRNAGGGIALTFLRVLARDLDRSLGDLASSSTFHRYAKALVHSLSPVGLRGGFPLYPPLLQLESEDLELLGEGSPTSNDIKKAIQDLDGGSALPRRALELGTYYNAAGFEDIVYRVYLHLDAHGDEIPVVPLAVVDEYQDFSLLETKFIDLLASRSKVLIAGDDDQALYGFRHASAAYIRSLARRPGIELHELPYCGRCTDVIVKAVVRTVERAQDAGHLKDRIPKEFVCYMPGKAADSAAHPKILEVHCATFDQMAKYIAREIALIPAEDIEASHEGKYPTVLVIGRKQFTTKTFEELSKDYPQAEPPPPTGEPEIDPVDGYLQLAKDERSNLGWRILIRVFPFRDWRVAVRDGLTRDEELIDHVPDEYRDQHLAIAAICRRLVAGENVDEEEVGRVAGAIGQPPEAVLEALHVSDRRGDDAVELSTEPEDEARLTIRFTSMNGAKGLSAEHVFVVGCVDGHFPENPADPSDQEISQFLVALSRTRKACHLISCKVFYPQTTLRPSLFVRWLAGLTEERPINAGVLSGRPSRPRPRRHRPRA